jgi:hypothetical protein
MALAAWTAPRERTDDHRTARLQRHEQIDEVDESVLMRSAAWRLARVARQHLDADDFAAQLP